MGTLFRDQSSFVNGFECEYIAEPLSDPLARDLVNGCQFEGRFGSPVPSLSNAPSPPLNVSPCEDESQVEGDYFDGVFKYIQQMLMEEEELEDRPCMLQDCLALQAAEKTFDQVLHEDPASHCRSPTPAFLGQDFDNPTDDFANIWNNHEGNGFSAQNDDFVHHQAFQSNLPPFNPVGASHSCNNIVHELVNPYANHFRSSTPSMASENETACQFRVGGSGNTFLQNKNFENNVFGLYEMIPREVDGQGRNSVGETSNGRKGTRSPEDNESDHNVDQRSSKQFASYTEEIEQTEIYDDALLCPDRNPNFYGESSASCCGETIEEEGTKKPSFQPPKPKRGRPRAGEKKSSIKEVVDLRDLLTRCAHAVASSDNGTAHELLKKIRQHSSAHGGATERLAHFFANALEARIAGMGSSLYTSLATRKASASDILKAYESYITICPFQRMSNIFANKNIARLTSSATRVHIIDFGILYGFQWPCIIHGISLRPGGPPRFRITGIDFPQPGFRPAERIEETGRRLASFCKRFDVPFEFNSIAKRWDAICLEELKIEKDEMVVVNCLYRLRNAPDETVTDRSPRDAVMDLIKKINPDLLVHGILNAGYNAPFFSTRFKQALHHFSSMFDMFEATLPPEDQERFMFEKEVLGRDIMNVIACEGAERLDRPDTYKQWQVRNQRAGFRQLPLNQKIMKEIRVKVKSSYHREFLVDEDSNWMLQGWKGRVIYALSYWKPVQK